MSNDKFLIEQLHEQQIMVTLGKVEERTRNIEKKLDDYIDNTLMYGFPMCAQNMERLKILEEDQQEQKRHDAYFKKFTIAGLVTLVIHQFWGFIS